jgi:hypothetical protein
MQWTVLRDRCAMWLVFAGKVFAEQQSSVFGALYSDTYGYASEGESISIADASGEVWIMEVIGRGPSYPKMGAV